MNTVQKIQKDKIVNENLILHYSDKPKKLPKKWPNFIKWPNAFFHGQHSQKMAKFFEIGHEMANLAILSRHVLR